MKQLDIVNSVSEINQFNEDLIYYRYTDSIFNHVNDICKSLEILEPIKFIGAELDEDESKIYKDWNIKYVEESRLNLLRLKFQINFKDEVIDIEKELFIPKLVDNFFFIINSSRYFPIYQIVDNGIFTTSKTYSLKTLLMPIRFYYKKEIYEDEKENIFNCFNFKLKLFKAQLNFLSYFFAKFGLYKTIDYFGLEYGKNKDICIVKSSPSIINKKHDNEYSYFNIFDNYYLIVKRKILKSSLSHSYCSFIFSLLEILKKNNTIENDPEYWKNKLGLEFTSTSTNAIEKAEKVLFSLERILDERTKKFLDAKDEDKEDIYAILRWMINSFEENRYMDPIDLEKKRINCWSYLVLPLLLHFSNKTYQIMNTKNQTIKTFQGIFNISPNFLIKKLVVNELLRYVGCVNNLDLFAAGLKATFKGSGSIGKGIDISDKFRGIHQSYIGNLDLVTSSAGDPGLTTTIVPFTNINNDRFVNFPGFDIE
jgi:hypothetical protein